MPFLSFELTMPQRGSWNGKWSGENTRHIVYKMVNDNIVWNLLKGFYTKDFLYNFHDGWVANIEVTDLSNVSFIEQLPETTDFCGYTWMIDSIITNGYIKATDGDKEMV